jgi:hypothetical protein
LGQFPGVIRGGEDDHRSSAGPGVGADGPEYLEAVEPGKLQIEKNQSGREHAAPIPERAPGKQKIQSFLPVSRHFDSAAGIQLANGSKGKLHLEWVVFDQEDVDYGRMRGGGDAGRVVLKRLCGHCASPEASWS